MCVYTHDTFYVDPCPIVRACVYLSMSVYNFFSICLEVSTKLYHNTVKSKWRLVRAFSLVIPFHRPQRNTHVMRLTQRNLTATYTNPPSSPLHYLTSKAKEEFSERLIYLSFFNLQLCFTGSQSGNVIVHHADCVFTDQQHLPETFFKCSSAPAGWACLMCGSLGHWNSKGLGVSKPKILEGKLEAKVKYLVGWQDGGSNQKPPTGL